MTEKFFCKHCGYNHCFVLHARTGYRRSCKFDEKGNPLGLEIAKANLVCKNCGSYIYKEFATMDKLDAYQEQNK